jgi:hypothetical protein
MHALVELHDSNYQPLADLTWEQNKVPYAEKHGYKTFCRIGGMKQGSTIGYQKIHFIRELMYDNPDIEWFWWTGTDAMIMNFNTRIEDKALDPYHYYVSADVNGINADSLLFRNTSEGRSFIEEVIRIEPEASKFWDSEQRAMATVMGLPPATGDDKWPPGTRISDQWKDICKIMPQRYMNAFNYELYHYTDHRDRLGQDGNWQVGDWLIHWPATSLEHRIRLASFYKEHIIK